MHVRQVIPPPNPSYSFFIPSRLQLEESFSALMSVYFFAHVLCKRVDVDVWMVDVACDPEIAEYTMRLKRH